MIVAYILVLVGFYAQPSDMPLTSIAPFPTAESCQAALKATMDKANTDPDLQGVITPTAFCRKVEAPVKS